MTITENLPLATGTWKADVAHSSVEFVVRHLGLTKVRGRFKSFDATLEVGTGVESSSLTASIDLSSVDTGNPDRDGHLQSTDFFDTASHPTMTFAATGIAPDSDGYAVDGDLTINGVTKPVRLDVEFVGSEVFPVDQKTHAGFSATTTISRKEYGVDFEIPLGVDRFTIGDKVAVELEIQLIQP